MKQLAAILALALIFSALPMLILFRGLKRDAAPTRAEYYVGQRFQNIHIPESVVRIVRLPHTGNGEVWIVSREDDETTHAIEAYGGNVLAVHYKPI